MLAGFRGGVGREGLEWNRRPFFVPVISVNFFGFRNIVLRSEMEPAERYTQQNGQKNLTRLNIPLPILPIRHPRIRLRHTVFFNHANIDLPVFSSVLSPGAGGGDIKGGSGVGGPGIGFSGGGVLQYVVDVFPVFFGELGAGEIPGRPYTQGILPFLHESSFQVKSRSSLISDMDIGHVPFTLKGRSSVSHTGKP